MLLTSKLLFFDLDAKLLTIFVENKYLFIFYKD